MFYKKRMNWQSLISIHSGIQQYCDESKSQHIQLSQDKGKVMVDISHSITIVQKVLVLDTKAIFFHKNFLGGEGGEWVHEIFQTSICFEFSKNIILKFSALKCFHVEIMMKGTEYSFTSPLWNFQKRA